MVAPPRGPDGPRPLPGPDLERVLRGIPAAVWVVDGDGTRVLVSDQWEEITGQPADAWLAEGVWPLVDPAEAELDPLSAAEVAHGADRTRDQNLEVLAGYAAATPGPAERRVVLRFLTSPVEIIGTQRVEAIVVAKNELYRGEDGQLRSRMTDRTETIPVDLVFRAIGYQGVPLPGIPFDAMRGVIPNQVGRITDPVTGHVVTGEYVVGWIKRGPQGIIGTNKPDSYETIDSLLEDLRAGRLDKAEVPDRSVLEGLLRERRADFVSYEDWQVIDLLEQERGREAGDRPRLKFSRVEEMLVALAERKAAQQDA